MEDCQTKIRRQSTNEDGLIVGMNSGNHRFIFLTPKPEKGSVDEKYAESVMKSFIPRRMPLATEGGVTTSSAGRGLESH